MKKFNLLLLLVLSTFIAVPFAHAETSEVSKSDTPAAVETAPAVAPATTEEAATTPEPSNAAVTTTETGVEPDEAAAKAAEPDQNLEFVSGEVTAVNEAAKTLSLKLYGETENSAENKTLTVTVDDSTDITDGEKDRDLKSLTAGTEVDAEYDPASNKATYIFVY